MKSFNSNGTAYNPRLLTLWNRISLWIGILISLGLSLIGNFQLESSNKVPKYLTGELCLSNFPSSSMLCVYQKITQATSIGISPVNFPLIVPQIWTCWVGND